MAAEFYSPADQLIYKDNQFIPQEQYRLGPYPNIHEGEEEVTQGSGIPYTNAFTNSGGSNDNAAALGAYTGRTYNPESYITNLGTSGRYIKGTEPEESYMSKIGGMIKSGIGMAIPGGNFLMNMAGKLDNFKNLSPADQEFARQQMNFQEQSVHPGGNLDNQDRYGYNKRSMFGNYADKVKERADIARQKAFENKDDPDYVPRDIDQYYLDKEEEQETLTNQMDFNDLVRNWQASKQLQKTGILEKKFQQPSYDVHGDGATTTGGGSKFAGDSGAAPGTPGSWNPGVGQDRPNEGRNAPGGGTGQSPTGGDVKGTPFQKGGRIGFFKGALADTAEGKAMSPGTSANYEPDQGHREGPQNTDTVPTNNLTVDTDFMSTQPSMELMYSPTELAKIKARLYNEDITKQDDINLEGQLSGAIGPLDYSTQFTDQGIGDTGINYNNLSALIDANKNIKNISFDKDIGNWNVQGNTDLKNYGLGAEYNKGPFFAGATIDNMGNRNFNVGAKWEFGQPERPSNVLSWQDENPNLIYGIEGQNLRYGGLASIL